MLENVRRAIIFIKRQIVVVAWRNEMSSQTKIGPTADLSRPPQGPQNHSDPSPLPGEAKQEHSWGLKDKKEQVQRGGIEPPTSAVLKPRHNQLDHLCLSPSECVIAV